MSNDSDPQNCQACELQRAFAHFKVGSIAVAGHYIALPIVAKSTSFLAQSEWSVDSKLEDELFTQGLSKHKGIAVNGEQQREQDTQ